MRSSHWRAAAGEGAEAVCSSARVGVGEGAGACSSTTSAAWGATGQLSGIRLGLWVSTSGGAAQSASMFIFVKTALGILEISLFRPPPHWGGLDLKRIKRFTLCK